MRHLLKEWDLGEREGFQLVLLVRVQSGNQSSHKEYQRMGFLRDIDHSVGEAAATPELNAAKGRRGRRLKQRCSVPWGGGMARAGGSQRQKVPSEQLWGGGAGSSLPSSGIHSLSSTTYRQRWQETNSPGKQVAGGMGLELRYKKGENLLVHEASDLLRDSQQVECWAKNRWHRRKKKRINKLCGQIPPAEKRACKKLDGIQAKRSHQFTSPREIWWGFPGGSDGKEYACDVGDLDLTPRSGRSPGEGMATRSRILAWRIPGTEESVGYSPWGCKSHDWVTEQQGDLILVLSSPSSSLTVGQ